MSEPDIVPLPPAPWVTMAEAADILGVTVERVRALMVRGRFDVRPGQK